MLRTPSPKNNLTYVWIIGAVVVGILLVVIGTIIGIALSSAGSSKPTALPQGFAETAIVLTLAAYPTDTPMPTQPPTNTPLPTNTFVPTLTPLGGVQNSGPAAPAAATKNFVTILGGTQVPGEYFITPVSTQDDYGCSCDEKQGCDDFHTPYDAQKCYDLCRAMLCTDVNSYESCDPWGLDASDGSLDSEHYVCGYGD